VRGSPVRYVVQLVVAIVAAVGAVLCWARVRSLVDIAPVTEGQPRTISVVYDPPMMVLALVLATTAGVLAILGVAGLRRRVSRITLDTYTP
jgi:NO-binding membrane sensor protein with MHYT domain